MIRNWYNQIPYPAHKTYQGLSEPEFYGDLVYKLKEL